MPVINLPRDERWGDLGKGLGGIIGGVLSAYSEHQTTSQVGEILQDPNIAENKKELEVLKKTGRKGLEIYDQLTKSQQMQATTKNLLAHVGLTNVQAALEGAKLPTADRRAEAETQTAEARPALVGAETKSTLATAGQTEALTAPKVATELARPALLGAETAATTATADKTKATTLPTAASESQSAALKAAESKKTDLESQILEGRIKALQNLQAGGNTSSSIDSLLAPFGLQEPQKAQWKTSLEQTYKGAELKSPGSGDAAVAGQLRMLASTMQKTEAPKPLTEPEQRFSSDSVQHATSAKRFIETFAKGGSSDIGFFSGANAKAFMEKWGIPTGDPALIDMWNAAQQQVASTATGGGGFFAQGRVKLAHDVTAGITETPLHALLATDQVADRQIAALEGRLSGFEGTAVVTKPIQKALEEWRQVKAITGTFKSDVIPDPRRLDDPTAGRTVAFFQGNQIDPKTFAPLVKNDKTSYKIKGGNTVPGSWLFEAARTKNKDPAQLLKELQ